MSEPKKGLSVIHWAGVVVIGGIAWLLLFGTRDDGTTGVGRLASADVAVERPNPKTPKDIAGLSNEIVGVVVDQRGEATEIILQKTRIWNDESVIFALASEANNIARGIQEHFKELKTPKIRFTIQMPLVDKFGNSFMTRVITINFRTSDLYKINYAHGFELQQFLNLYEGAWYVHPVAHNLVYAFCKSEPGQYATEFCRRERLGQGAQGINNPPMLRCTAHASSTYI